MLADLDKTLRGLMRDELERHGFDDVEIAFDAPSRERSGELFKPAVTVVLYGMREAEGLRAGEWAAMRRNERTSRADPNGHGGESSAVSE